MFPLKLNLTKNGQVYFLIKNVHDMFYPSSAPGGKLYNYAI